MKIVDHMGNVTTVDDVIDKDGDLCFDFSITDNLWFISKAEALKLARHILKIAGESE